MARSNAIAPPFVCSSASPLFSRSNGQLLFNSPSRVLYNRPELCLCGFTSDCEYLAAIQNRSLKIIQFVIQSCPIYANAFQSACCRFRARHGPQTPGVKMASFPLCAGPYIAPAWLRGGNAQTIYPYLLSRPFIPYRRERWELDDGDFIDIDWLDSHHDAPLVVLFHGLEGSSCSHYVLSIMGMLQELGWRGAVVHFRGCSGSPNRLPRAYHAGDSTEIDWILKPDNSSKTNASTSPCLFLRLAFR